MAATSRKFAVDGVNHRHGRHDAEIGRTAPRGRERRYTLLDECQKDNQGPSDTNRNRRAHRFAKWWRQIKHPNYQSQQGVQKGAS